MWVSSQQNVTCRHCVQLASPSVGRAARAKRWPTGAVSYWRMLVLRGWSTDTVIYWREPVARYAAGRQIVPQEPWPTASHYKTNHRLCSANLAKIVCSRPLRHYVWVLKSFSSLTLVGRRREKKNQIKKKPKSRLLPERAMCMTSARTESVKSGFCCVH